MKVRPICRHHSTKEIEASKNANRRMVLVTGTTRRSLCTANCPGHPCPLRPYLNQHLVAIALQTLHPTIPKSHRQFPPSTSHNHQFGFKPSHHSPNHTLGQGKPTGKSTVPTLPQTPILHLTTHPHPHPPHQQSALRSHT